MSRDRTAHWYQVESMALFLLTHVSQSLEVLASLLTSAPIRSTSVQARLYAVHERLAMLLAAQEGEGDIQGGP